MVDSRPFICFGVSKNEWREMFEQGGLLEWGYMDDMTVKAVNFCVSNWLLNWESQEPFT